MQEDLVSVIIPFYEVQDFIEDCLKSIINQTYKNLEIICVDDCGKDNSTEIVRKYINIDSRIKLVQHTQNMGISVARNTGINNAKGKYIYFIDSDDFIDNDYIEKLVDTIIQNNVDLVCNNKILKYYKNDKKNKFIKKENDFILNKKVDFDEKIARKTMISTWCKLYKRDFLKNNNIYFPEKIIFEDFVFLHILKTKIKNIVFTYNSTYYYRQRENSLIHKDKEKSNNLDSIIAIKNIYNYYEKNDLLSSYSIPFSWLKKFFKKQINKNDYFNLLKNEFLNMKSCILKNKKIYSKKDLIFFDTILKSKNYKIFKLLYSIRKIINL